MKMSNEVKVGIMVTIVLAGLVFLTFRVGNFNFGQEGYSVTVLFRNIEGLAKEAPVRLSGLEVGRVSDLQLVYDKDETRIELTLWLRDDAKLREGAKAFVKTMGFLGDKYLGLTPGDPHAPFLKPGAVIMGQEPVDLEELMAEGKEIAQNIKEISENINERMRINAASIDKIIANVNDATANIASLSGNIDERLRVNQGHIDALIAHLSAAGKNLEEMSEDLKMNPWKLLYREKPKRTEAK